MSKPKTRLPRRDFLKSAAMGMTAPWIIPNHVLGKSGQTGANDRIEIGLIGVGMRGKYLLANLPQSARVTALCDFSLSQIETARKPTERFTELLKPFAENEGKSCKLFQDYRRMISEHTLDAVIIAAPDHHHAQACILACQAECDVYVEKPLAVTIEEGRAMVEAAKKYKRVVQVGSQQRSMSVNRRACEFVRDGGLGKIHYVEERNLPGPMPYEQAQFPAETPPTDLDWNLFCGPTELRPYHRDLWVKDHYKRGFLTWRGWDLFQDYSGHLMTNWGAHSVDMTQYALGTEQTGPVKIEPHLGDVTPFTDDQWHEKTPPLGTIRNKAIDKARFAPLTITYASGTEIRFLPGVRKTTFYGEDGKLTLSRNRYEVEPKTLLPPPDKQEQELWSGDGHVARPHLENWLEAIRTRGETNAPVEVGHRSVSVCHLANLARRLNRSLEWDPVMERFVRDDEANGLLSRPRRNGFELPT